MGISVEKPPPLFLGNLIFDLSDIESVTSNVNRITDEHVRWQKAG